MYDCWIAAFPGPDKFDNERMMEGGYGFAQFMFSNNMTKMADACVLVVPLGQFVLIEKFLDYSKYPSN